MQPDSTDFGDLVREKLKGLGETQNWLASEAGFRVPKLSTSLNTQRATDDEEVVRLAHALNEPLDHLLLAACVARCKHRAKSTDDSVEKKRWLEAGSAYKEILAQFRVTEPSSRPPQRSQGFVTLQDFPEMLEGSWCILIGDRRERPPKGLGDLVALSVGATDLMFVASLRLPPETTVLSDKIIRVASEENLKELLGHRNLLLIGSPAVSLATREILRRSGATMMFNIGDAWFEREARLYERLDGPARSDAEALAEFLEDPWIASEIDDILPNYRKSGFVDPVDFKLIRGVAISRDQDYGMVALAPNPWSAEHLVCICAGVHGGGTAGGLRMLASPERFKDCPWGGVFRVNLSDQVAWEKRFSMLYPRWETHPYDPQKYLDDLKDLAVILEDRPQNNEAETTDDSQPVHGVEVSREKLQQMVAFAGQLASGRIGQSKSR